MSTKKWDVYVYGDVNIDIVIPGVEKFPEPGQEDEVSVMETFVGGGAALFTLGVGKLGLRPVFQGEVGDDCYGELIRSKFRESHVDDSLLPAWPRLLDAVVRFAPADCLLLAEGRMRRDLLDGQGELEFRPLPDDSPLRLCDAEGNAVSLLQARAPLWRILGRPRAPRCCPGWQEERTVVLRGDD